MLAGMNRLVTINFDMDMTPPNFIIKNIYFILESEHKNDNNLYYLYRVSGKTD